MKKIDNEIGILRFSFKSMENINVYIIIRFTHLTFSSLNVLKREWSAVLLYQRISGLRNCDLRISDLRISDLRISDLKL